MARYSIDKLIESNGPNKVIELNVDSYYGNVLVGRAIYLREREKYDNNEAINENELNQAIDYYNKALKYVERSDRKAVLSQLYDFIGNAYELLGYNLDARDCYLLALEDSGDHRRDIMQEIDNLERGALSNLWDNYISVDPSERKFIMPIEGRNIDGCVANSVDVFRMSNIPSCIEFPQGHPCANQLYINHPCKPSLYVPYEKSEEVFFVDRVHDYMYLLECLGAVDITITALKGSNTSILSSSGDAYNAGGSIKAFGAGGSYNSQHEYESSLSQQNNRSYHRSLDPIKKPYVPNDLEWIEHEPTWQNLVRSRLNNNMLEHHETISSSYSRFVSSSQQEELKAEVGFLWLKANYNSQHASKEVFKESQETIWQVDVKFRSLREFNNGDYED